MLSAAALGVEIPVRAHTTMSALHADVKRQLKSVGGDEDRTLLSGRLAGSWNDHANSSTLIVGQI